MKTLNHLDCISHVKTMAAAASRKWRMGKGFDCCSAVIVSAILLVMLALVPPNSRAEGERPSTSPPAAPEAKAHDLEIYNGMLLAKGAPSESASGLKATLKQVVNRLRENYPEANIVMPPGLADVPVGDLKLRSGSLWDELEAVRVASDDKFDWKGPGMNGFVGREGWFRPAAPSGIDPTTGLPPKEMRFPNAGLFVLREDGRAPENERIVEAFNIGPYLDWLAEKRTPELGVKPDHPDYQANVHAIAYEGREQLMKMITGTLAAFNQGRSERTPEPKFEFHEGARLLVVIGTREAIDITRKIVSALPTHVVQPSALSVPPMANPLPGPGQAPGPSPSQPPLPRIPLSIRDWHTNNGNQPSAFHPLTRSRSRGKGFHAAAGKQHRSADARVGCR
jgi:hypothetical protein